MQVVNNEVVWRTDTVLQRQVTQSLIIMVGVIIIYLIGQRKYHQTICLAEDRHATLLMPVTVPVEGLDNTYNRDLPTLSLSGKSYLLTGPRLSLTNAPTRLKSRPQLSSDAVITEMMKIATAAGRTESPTLTPSSASNFSFNMLHTTRLLFAVGKPPDSLPWTEGEK